MPESRQQPSPETRLHERRAPRISIASGRYFLTDRIRDDVDFRNTPQHQGILPPPVQKPTAAGARIFPLAPPSQWTIPQCDLVTAFSSRESRRRFRDVSLSLDELAFLLWATQGVRERLHPAAVTRTVPSAGCRHPFETYLAVLHVSGLSPGIYRYLPLEHALVLVADLQATDLAERIVTATRGQSFTSQAAVTFFWSALPFRTEWRYAEASSKVIALDAGHVCQNLYLACEAIHAGTCAIAAYDQDCCDQLLGIDGTEEFVIYLAPVGKL